MAPRNLGGEIILTRTLSLTLLTCLSGVVDPRFKIYGLTNVRVVDASVIPLTTGVAIQSTVYAIAEKVGLYLDQMTGSDQVASSGRGYLQKRVGSRVVGRKRRALPPKIQSKYQWP
jgi:hypothetical protein